MRGVARVVSTYYGRSKVMSTINLVEGQAVGLSPNEATIWSDYIKELHKENDQLKETVASLQSILRLVSTLAG
jgi:hypothetical protein